MPWRLLTALHSNKKGVIELCPLDKGSLKFNQEKRKGAYPNSKVGNEKESDMEEWWQLLKPLEIKED